MAGASLRVLCVGALFSLPHLYFPFTSSASLSLLLRYVKSLGGRPIADLQIQDAGDVFCLVVGFTRRGDEVKAVGKRRGRFFGGGDGSTIFKFCFNLGLCRSCVGALMFVGALLTQVISDLCRGGAKESALFYHLGVSV